MIYCIVLSFVGLSLAAWEIRPLLVNQDCGNVGMRQPPGRTDAFLVSAIRRDQLIVDVHGGLSHMLCSMVHTKKVSRRAVESSVMRFDTRLKNL
jgi:hypothetical protein